MIEQIIKQWEAEWEMRREEFKRRTEDLTDEEKDKEFEIFLKELVYSSPKSKLILPQLIGKI